MENVSGPRAQSRLDNFSRRALTHFELVKVKATKHKSVKCDMCESNSTVVMWFDDLGRDGPIVRFCEAHKSFPSHLRSLSGVRPPRKK